LVDIPFLFVVCIKILLAVAHLRGATLKKFTISVGKSITIRSASPPVLINKNIQLKYEFSSPYI
jgi:hypothetical protein